MTNKEYLEIFQSENLKRSKLVRLIEKQIRIFVKNGMQHEAEEAKWVAIFTAQDEKAQKFEFIQEE